MHKHTMPSITHTTLLLFLLLLLLSSFAAASTSSAHQWITLTTTLMHQACSNVSSPGSCLLRLRTELEPDSSNGPFSVIHAALRLSIDEALEAIDLVERLAAVPASFREHVAIQDCMELLEYSVDELGLSLAEMRRRTQLGGSRAHARREGDLGAWLSAALSNQDTCLEGFEGTDGRMRHYVKGSVTQVTQLVTNVMAMYKRMSRVVPLRPPREGDRADGGAPEWVGEQQHRVAVVNVDPRAMHVDATVAKDGSGEYGSVAEAVNAAPNHGTRRYVIYVRKGVYYENVEVKKKKTNIMIVGDGRGETVVSGDRSFAQGWTTFRTATFAVSGQGFIARDITFRNTAGPQSHQAVALRVDSDRSAFLRCSIEGYQDTLYAHSLRQFYRDCDIHGTVDFIFGNGNAVIQHCRIFTRRPLPSQKVTLTAQGRKSADQTTGFSIHNSFVHATQPAYLGRPWKPYSRTVFMQTYMSDKVHPRGWLEWDGDFALSTLYYGEYMNYGPGASLRKRVKWRGYHVISDVATAAFFTVRRFINGLTWLPWMGVVFTADLIR